MIGQAYPLYTARRLRTPLGGNVKLYDAKGDGTTDDSSSIQQAYDAVVLAGGGQVILPPGEYLLSTGVTATSSVGVTFVGAGKSTVLRSDAPDMGALILITGDNTTVENLSLDGVYVSGGQQGNFGLVTINGAKNCKVTRCWIENSGHHGVQMNGAAHDIAIYLNYFAQNFCSVQSLDVDADNVPMRVSVIFNDFDPNWGTGSNTGAVKLSCDGGRGGTTRGHNVSFNHIRGTGQMGIELWGRVADSLAQGNVITEVEFGISFDSCVNSSAKGNTISRFVYCGLEAATDCEHVLFEGNICDGRDADGDPYGSVGIVSSSLSRPKHIKAVNNHIRGINGPGIKFQTSDYCQALSNTIEDCTSAVTVAGSNNVIIRLNDIKGTFGTFIFIDCYDETGIESINISFNSIYGNANDNGLTIYARESYMTIDRLVVAYNDLLLATTSANSIYDNVGSRLTNYIRVGNHFIDAEGECRWTDGGTSIPPYTPSQQGFGIPVAKRFEFTVPTNASAQWMRVLNADFGSPIVLWVNVHAYAQYVSNDADNINVFFGCSPYGFGSDGMKMPHTRYEDGIVEEIIYNNPGSGPYHEVWIKVKATTGPYTLGVAGSDFPNDWITAPSFVTTEPTWASNSFRILCNHGGLAVKNMRFLNLPTSSAGLPTGTPWNNAGALYIA